jgi:hypothetical protein
MSPLFVPIILAIFVGIIVLVIGLIARKKILILIGAPAAALLLAWFLVASIPPNPRGEFNRIFGESNGAFAADIATRKPTMMDGHFIWFQMSQEDFDKRIRPQFKETEFTNFHLLQGQKLPSGWPQSVATATSALHKEIDHQEILVYYDIPTRAAYASVLYDRW